MVLLPFPVINIPRVCIPFSPHLNLNQGEIRKVMINDKEVETNGLGKAKFLPDYHLCVCDPSAGWRWCQVDKEGEGGFGVGEKTPIEAAPMKVGGSLGVYGRL